MTRHDGDRRLDIGPALRAAMVAERARVGAGNTRRADLVVPVVAVVLGLLFVAGIVGALR